MKHYLSDIWEEIKIFDDGSPDPRIGEEFIPYFSAPEHRTLSEKEANSRCGAQRKLIIDWFLNHSDKPYLVWIDDDIIINSSTIQKGLEDCEGLITYLSSGSEPAVKNVGIYSFHVWMEDSYKFPYNNSVYGVFALTGESCCIIPRGSLEAVGNNFGSFEGGYLDVHARKMREKGFHLVCRLLPPWDVQHIGIEDSSFIHSDNLKYWHTSLWHNYSSREFLTPKKFDPDKYLKLVEEYGARYAPRYYLTHLEDTFGDVKDTISLAEDEVVFTVRRADTGEIVNKF